MGGRSINSITSHARQYLDIKNDQYEPRKYEHDRTFFAEPNMVNSYIAGFLAADGCIRQDKAGHWRLRLEISNVDRDHLLWIRDTMKHEGPLQAPKNKATLFWQIFVDEPYVKDLERNFGVVWRKTHRLQPPNLGSFELRLAYLLGLLDGDGCVHISTQNMLTVGYTSASMTAIQWYQAMMTEMNFPSVQRNTKLPQIGKHFHANAHYLVYGGARAVCLVQLAQAFAHKHNLPILARKWDNPALNAYILDFYTRFPTFEFNPSALLDPVKFTPFELVDSTPPAYPDFLGMLIESAASTHKS